MQMVLAEKKPSHPIPPEKWPLLTSRNIFVGASVVRFKKPKNDPFWAFWGIPKMALGVPESKFKDHFSIQIPPLKPPFRHFGNHFGPWKSDFWPFYLFWSFSHWNSHWSRKKVPTWEGKVVEQKQKQFWKPWGKWQNLGACKIMISEKS